MEALRRRNANAENAPLPGKARLVKAKVVGTRKPLGGITSNIPVLKGSTGILKDKQDIKKPQLKGIKEPAKEVIDNAMKDIQESLSVIEKSHSSAQLPDNIDNIDADDAENPHLVSVYVSHIYTYLRELEVSFPIRKGFLSHQPEITGKMRAILLDWLIQVHQRFHLLLETLYMTVSIIDRFLQEQKVKKSELQLVGVAAMFIACKFEEMYAPDVSDFEYITDNSYTKANILKMEVVILRKLDFNLSRPLPLHFLRRNSKAGNVDSTVHTLAKYLMELTIPEYDLAHYQPSHLAAAASYLSIKILSDLPWSETLQYHSQFTESGILPLVKCMCKLLLHAESAKLQAVYLKYAASKWLKISTCPQLKSAIVKKLARDS